MKKIYILTIILFFCCANDEEVNYNVDYSNEDYYTNGYNLKIKGDFFNGTNFTLFKIEDNKAYFLAFGSYIDNNTVNFNIKDYSELDSNKIDLIIGGIKNDLDINEIKKAKKYIDSNKSPNYNQDYKKYLEYQKKIEASFGTDIRVLKLHSYIINISS